MLLWSLAMQSDAPLVLLTLLKVPCVRKPDSLRRVLYNPLLFTWLLFPTAYDVGILAKKEDFFLLFKHFW